MRPWRILEGDPASVSAIDGVDVVAHLRIRRDGKGSLLLLADGRYALPSESVVAVGGRRQLAGWIARRLTMPGISTQDRAWLQEVAGALAAPN